MRGPSPLRGWGVFLFVEGCQRRGLMFIAKELGHNPGCSESCGSCWRKKNLELRELRELQELIKSRDPGAPGAPGEKKS